MTEYRNDLRPLPSRREPEGPPSAVPRAGKMKRAGRAPALAAALVLVMGGALAYLTFTGYFNQHPSASIAADRPVLFVGGTVNFSGSGSADPDGTVSAYRWNFGDDFNLVETGSARVPHAYARPGRFRAGLTVEDDRGALSATAHATVVVLPHPVSDTRTAWTYQTVTFSVETAALGDAPVNFTWIFPDGLPASGPVASHQFRDGGQFEIWLIASWNGRSAQSSVPVHIFDQPPSAGLNLSRPGPFHTDEEVQFDGSRSSDRDGSIRSWSWDFGDGRTNTGNESQARHLFAREGLYHIVLTVTDDDGGRDSCSIDIMVLKDLLITGFRSALYTGGDGVLRANLTVGYGNSGGAKAPGTICVTVRARAWDRSPLEPVGESVRSVTVDVPVFGSTEGLTVDIRDILVDGSQPDLTWYLVELACLDNIADSAWFQQG